MRAADLETVFLIALPPLRLALRERYLKVRRLDPIAVRVAVEELAAVELIRARLARQGWWVRRQPIVSNGTVSRNENVPLPPRPCNDAGLASVQLHRRAAPAHPTEGSSLRHVISEPTMTQETEELLCALRGSPTDLAKLGMSVHQGRRRVVAISQNAITRWNKDDLDSWDRVRAWLTMRGVQRVIVA